MKQNNKLINKALMDEKIAILSGFLVTNPCQKKWLKGMHIWQNYFKTFFLPKI